MNRGTRTTQWNEDNTAERGQHSGTRTTQRNEATQLNEAFVLLELSLTPAREESWYALLGSHSTSAHAPSSAAHARPHYTASLLDH